MHTQEKLLSKVKAWSETFREVDVGWMLGGMARNFLNIKLISLFGKCVGTEQAGRWVPGLDEGLYCLHVAL